MNPSPIGVFDSGLGGLSVVRRLVAALPAEDIVYFGDTARVPYGTKSHRTVATFALEDARFLLRHEPKLLVVACNTASALALEELQAEMPVPVIGVIEPGAAAAVRVADGRPIAVLGTEATITSGAYLAAIRRLRADAIVEQRACPLFVPLVEEGRSADDEIVRLTARGYLSGLSGVGACVLGCTHYPLLRDAIASALGESVSIIDSGSEAALAVRERLTASGELSAATRTGTLRCFVSDNPTRFRAVGSRFLGQDIEQVEFIAPERYIGDASLEGTA